MTPRTPRASAWLVLGGALVLIVYTAGACSRPPESAGPDADTTATTAPSTPATPAAPTRLPVRQDLLDAHPVTWRTWKAVNEMALEFTVTAGPADCYGAQPKVVESDTQVRVQIRIGRLPEAADRDCPAIALEAIVPVHLASPLGTRHVEPLTQTDNPNR